MKMMMAAAAIAALAVAGAAAAGDDPAGAWKVNGSVDGKDFVVTCHFEHHGEALSGACFDSGTNLKHALISGAANGGEVKWTYVSHFGLLPFNVIYAGKQSGASMRGSVTAPGHVGSFTAAKE